MKTKDEIISNTQNSQVVHNGVSTRKTLQPMERKYPEMFSFRQSNPPKCHEATDELLTSAEPRRVGAYLGSISELIEISLIISTAPLRS